ncbi:MAG: hypothetical protein RL033_7776 [Pseudomonadota bacterium]
MAWASGRLRGALVVWSALTLASSARAEADVSEPNAPEPNAPEPNVSEPGGWLHWQGPVECQNTREVERQLESLLGYAPAADQLPPTRVEVGWGSARGWSLRIRVSLPQGERRREVVVRTCADGFDVVGLTLALILDPDLDMDAGLDSEPVPESGLLASTELAAVPAPAAAGRSAPSVSAPSLGQGAVDTAAEANALEPPSGGPALRLAGGGRADLGSLPATLFGGGLSLAWSGWHWRMDAGAAYLQRGTQTLPLAVNEVSYSNLLGVVRGCREFSPRGGGYFDLCLGSQLGSLAVSELGGERRQARGLWAAATLGAEIGLDLTDAWGAFSGVELVFPLARHELGLAGGAVVYELPAVSVQLTLGGILRLTESALP